MINSWRQRAKLTEEIAQRAQWVLQTVMWKAQLYVGQCRLRHFTFTAFRTIKITKNLSGRKNSFHGTGKIDNLAGLVMLFTITWFRMLCCATLFMKEDYNSYVLRSNGKLLINHASSSNLISPSKLWIVILDTFLNSQTAKQFEKYENRLKKNVWTHPESTEQTSLKKKSREWKSQSVVKMKLIELNLYSMSLLSHS